MTVTARIPSTLKAQLTAKYGSVTAAILSLDGPKKTAYTEPKTLPEKPATSPPKPTPTDKPHYHRRTGDPTLIDGTQTWQCDCGTTLH